METGHTHYITLGRSMLLLGFILSTGQLADRLQGEAVVSPHSLSCSPPFLLPTPQAARDTGET